MPTIELFIRQSNSTATLSALDINHKNTSFPINNNEFVSSSQNALFVWPLPNFTRISSYFGRRSSPTAYASSYHKGIDIPAPSGTNIYAAMSGTVILAKFNGSGGCNVYIQNTNFIKSYCHVSPNFLVCVGTYVEKGQLIAQVGPKNVYGIPGNTYKDSNGNPTNGATTGSHLHFAIRRDSEYLNPLDFFNI